MRISGSPSASAVAALPAAETAVIAVQGLAYLLLLLWLVTPAPPVGFYWDGSWYLLMAEWLSGRGEYRDLAWSMLHLRQYPPGYPALLAAAGAGLARPDAGFIVNAVAGTAAAIALMLWMRRTERFSMPSTAAAAALLVLSPVALTWLPALFSEHFFVLLTVVALWLAAAARKPLSWALLGFVIGLAIITRSAGVALLVAIGVSAALSNWRRLPWLVLGLLPALLAGWWLIHDLPSVPRYRSLLGALHAVLTDPGQLRDQITGLAAGWSEIWGSGFGGGIALLVVIPGLWHRIRRHCADAWLVPATLAMLLLWPFPSHMPRLLWPLLPALLVCAGETARRLERKPLRLAALWAMPIVLALGLHGGAMRTVMRVIDAPPPPLDSLSRMHEWTRSEDPGPGIDALKLRHQLLRDMQQIQAIVPGISCVYSEYPALVAVQGRRACLASPWQRLSELDSHRLSCEYYYLVPLALPETSPEDVERTTRKHQLIFQSPNAVDPSSEEITGALFRLHRD